MTEPPRVHVRTLGCKVNQAESDAIAAALDASGLEPSAPDAATVVVINTCTVTGEADRKARKAIRHALQLPGAPTVVVTGCLAATDPAGVAALGERVIVEPDKERVAGRVGAVGPAAKDVGSTAGHVLTATRARVQVKVQDGCATFCAYCIVPYARGGPRSVPLATVVETVSGLRDAGVSEVVLTGINIGCYRDDGAGLPELIEAVAATGIARVRLSSVEPGDVTERLLEVAARTPAFCRHLHVPLQSGADRTLVAMRRPYDVRSYADVVRRAREALPGLALTTDVIVGFPGETDADHQESLAFIDEIGFSRLHVFRYSARAGTPAAIMPDQVPAAVKTRRAAAMRALGESSSARAAGARIGSCAEVLVERVVPAPDGEGLVAEGTTREYLRVRVPVVSARPGDLLHVVVEDMDADGTAEGLLA